MRNEVQVYRAAYARAPRVSLPLPRAYRVGRREERIRRAVDAWIYVAVWFFVAFCAVVGAL